MVTLWSHTSAKTGRKEGFGLDFGAGVRHLNGRIRPNAPEKPAIRGQRALLSATGVSSKQIAQAAGITDEGQASKLLNRLQRYELMLAVLIVWGLTCGCVLCTVLFVPVLVWVWGLKHKIGFGSVFVVDKHWFDGVPWERDRVATRERVVCVFALGNSAVESPCRIGGSVIGRVSVADASLSLSLSLSLGQLPSRR